MTSGRMYGPLRVIASEARQSSLPHKGRMDCFVAAPLLAMTVNAISHSRGALRPSLQNRSPKENRGRRERRVRAAPAVSCAKVHERNAHEHTGSAEAIRHSPRNGFTAYAVLSPATNSSCHRRQRISGLFESGRVRKNLRRLDTSNGCQDHTVLPYVAASFVCMNSIAHGKPALRFRFTPDAAASTASRPNVRDDGQRPSSRDGMGRASTGDLPDGESGIFLQRGLDRF